MIDKLFLNEKEMTQCKDYIENHNHTITITKLPDPDDVLIYDYATNSLQPKSNMNFHSEKAWYFKAELVDLVLVESDHIGTFTEIRLKRIGNEYLKVFQEFMK